MTPHTPLIEALKETENYLLNDIAATGETTGDAFLDFCSGRKDRQELLGTVREALRIATETTEPDAVQETPPPKAWLEAKAEVDAGWPDKAAQSIRAEAFKDAADEIQKRANNLRGDRKRINQIDLHVIGVLESAATAIRSLGDRG